MGSMTKDSASARPYRVFVRVIDARFEGNLRLQTHVDRGLSPAEIDSLGSPADLKKLALTSLTGTPVTPIVLVALAAWGLTELMQGSAASGVAWAAVNVAVAAVLAVSYWTRKTITRRMDRLTESLIEAGRLANPHARRSDLRRIQAALTVLQTSSGTAFDVLARNAVIAVLEQDLNSPSVKTVAIAESKASDPDSTAIRARVLAQKAQRDADVAKAESLIFELEQFAAEKKSSEPVTAG